MRRSSGFNGAATTSKSDVPGSRAGSSTVPNAGSVPAVSTIAAAIERPKCVPRVTADAAAAAEELTSTPSRSVALNGQLQVGGVLAAGVDDVLPLLAPMYSRIAGHHRSQQVAGADDEAQLLTGVERETDWAAGRFRRRRSRRRTSFSTRSKVWAGTSSVDSASSRWRADTRSRPSDPLYRRMRGPVIGEVVDHARSGWAR